MNYPLYPCLAGVGWGFKVILSVRLVVFYQQPTQLLCGLTVSI